MRLAEVVGIIYFYIDFFTILSVYLPVLSIHYAPDKHKRQSLKAPYSLRTTFSEFFCPHRLLQPSTTSQHSFYAIGEKPPSVEPSICEIRLFVGRNLQQKTDNFLRTTPPARVLFSTGILYLLRRVRI